MAGEEHLGDGGRGDQPSVPGGQLQGQGGQRAKSRTQNSEYMTPPPLFTPQAAEGRLSDLVHVEKEIIVGSSPDRAEGLPQWPGFKSGPWPFAPCLPLSLSLPTFPVTLHFKLSNKSSKCLNILCVCIYIFIIFSGKCIV